VKDEIPYEVPTKDKRKKKNIQVPQQSKDNGIYSSVHFVKMLKIFKHATPLDTNHVNLPF
jgi:hypothetical protein